MEEPGLIERGLRAGGRSARHGRAKVPWYAWAILCAAAPAAPAQEGAKEEKPEMELPAVVIESLDQSLLGAGGEPTAPEVKEESLPLAIPPLGPPVPVRLSDPTSTRPSFDDIPPAERPPSLRVRLFAEAARYRTLLAGVDALREVANGGVFGELFAEASDGHLEGAPWSRARAKLGASVKPSDPNAMRVEASYHAREQELPVDGFLTRSLNAPDRTQRFRQGGIDFRYRFEEDGGFVAGASVRGALASFRRMTGATSQGLVDGEAAAHLEMPLRGDLWALEMNLALGTRREEDMGGAHDRRRRLTAEAFGRIGTVSGWSVRAGVGFRRFGEREVFGPHVRLTHQDAPRERYWVGLAPHLEEPDIVGFWAGTPYASGEVGQEAERAPVRVEAGIEVKPGPDVSFSAMTSMRRSRGFLHTERAAGGLYRLANLERRWVSQTDCRFEWKLVGGFELSADYRLVVLDGSDVAYVVPHSGSARLARAGTLSAGVGMGVIGARDGSPGEGRLPAAWLLSADLGWEILDRWRVTVRGENLLDRDHRPFGEYAAEGMNVRGGVRYAF
jgi:hypothetical protein